MRAYDDPARSTADLLFGGRDPDAVAYTLIAPDLTSRTLTWGELDRESMAVARGLVTLGIRAGDRVATLMPKSADYLATLFGLWRLGCVHVPIFTAFGAEPIAYRLTASACRVLVCDPSQEHKLPAAPPPGTAFVTAGPSSRGHRTLEEVRQQGSAGALASALAGPLIEIYTSGTTGKPKGVLVGRQALAAFEVYLRLGLGLTENDVFWNAADPGWAYGLYYSVLAPVVTGVPAILYEGAFKPELYLRILTDFRVTNFAAAPTVYRAIEAANLPRPGPLALRCASSAGEPLTPATNTWAKDFLGVTIHDHYGQTETGMIVNNHQHPRVARPLKPGSMGRPMPGWAVAILQAERDEPAVPGELGRVAVDRHASPLCWFEGYVQDPARSADKFSRCGRWYLTGDVGQCDADGDLFFASRDDDVIIMSGYRIGPIEIEAALLTHGAVAECAVVAVPHAISGEMVEAVVVLKDGVEPSERLTGELQQAVKRGFAAHAYPRRVHYVTALPKTASGKIQRAQVRALLTATAGTETAARAH